MQRCRSMAASSSTGGGAPSITCPTSRRVSDPRMAIIGKRYRDRCNQAAHGQAKYIVQCLRLYGEAAGEQAAHVEAGLLEQGDRVLAEGGHGAQLHVVEGG